MVNTTNASQAHRYPPMSLFNQLLIPDLFNQIQAFQRPSYWRTFCPKEQAYWKNRFTQDIIPSLDKGYRLVEFEITSHGTNIPCANCYHYGLCEECIILTVDHISYEEIREHSNRGIWNLEQCRGLPKTLYGRYAMNKWPKDPNQLELQLRRKIEKIFPSNSLESIRYLFL